MSWRAVEYRSSTTSSTRPLTLTFAFHSVLHRQPKRLCTKNKYFPPIGVHRWVIVYLLPLPAEEDRSARSEEACFEDLCQLIIHCTKIGMMSRTANRVFVIGVGMTKVNEPCSENRRLWLRGIDSFLVWKARSSRRFRLSRHGERSGFQGREGCRCLLQRFRTSVRWLCLW